MIDNERRFYQEEKMKFDQLLNRLGWTEENLLEKQETLMQCPFDRHHRFPQRSKHVQNCQLVKEGFQNDIFEYEKDKQSTISLTSTMISEILQRPVSITDNIPLSVEQMTVLFTPNERYLISQAVHNQAMKSGIVPPSLPSFSENLSTKSKDSNICQQSNKLAELRDQKRRRTKYVSRTVKKSFYDTAREIINTQMELIQEKNSELNPPEKHRKKRKHRSSRSHSRKHHHRHSKKRRKRTPD